MRQGPLLSLGWTQCALLEKRLERGQLRKCGREGGRVQEMWLSRRHSR